MKHFYLIQDTSICTAVQVFGYQLITMSRVYVSKDLTQHTVPTFCTLIKYLHGFTVSLQKHPGQ